MALHTIEICAGVGMLGEGLRAGLAHLGYPLRTVCYLEREAYPAAVIAARCEEGSLDPAPVWSDLLTFDAGAWRGAVDGIVAGFPCQDLSLAGRRAGLDGKRSGLFFNILDIADDCGAWFLFLENVAGISSATASVVDEESASEYVGNHHAKGFSQVGIEDGRLLERAASRVVGELAERGWHAEWLTISASDVGASHGRERWFCFAWRMGDAGLQHQQLQQRNEGPQPARADGPMGHPQRPRRPPTGRGPEQPPRREPEPGCGGVADASSPGQQGRELGTALHGDRGGEETHGPVEQLRRPLFAPGPTDPAWGHILTHWPELAPALEPDFRGAVDGMAFAMDQSRAQRLKCVGNGVVALQAAAAFVRLARRAGLR